MNRIMDEIITDVKTLDQAFQQKTICHPYGWHDRKLPPELRKVCLNGKAFSADRNTYLYILMSSWYEKISGGRAPCNFEVYTDWKKKLRIGGREHYGLEGPEINNLIHAIQEGTHFDREKRDPEKVLAVLNRSDDICDV